MARFDMCPDCFSEYSDPLNRRFHAQPVACPVCGPQVWLEESGSPQPVLKGDDAVKDVRRRLLDGQILAIKGLGGFHLACDDTNPQAVAELRSRKLRIGKPFALMLADIEQIE